MTRRNRRGGPLWGLLAAILILGWAMPLGALAAEEPKVAATGALVMDFQTEEVYYEKEPDLARPAASMTKVMSLYLVFEEMAAGRLSLDSLVTASPRAAGISQNRAYSGLERLRAGESYPVDTLLRLIMTASCNGSVIVLAEHIGGTEEAFVQRMNDTAAAWGIDAHFADACGFEDEGNAVSPRAMAQIARRIITDYPQILDYSALPETYFQGKTFYSTNTLLRNGTCEGIDGLKSGTTEGAGYCYVGTAIREGRRIISVAMNSTGYGARMNDTRLLLEYGFQCREQREALWREAANGFQAELTVAGGQVWPRGETGLTATLSGLPAEIPCTVAWEIGGQLLEESEADVTVGEGRQLQASFTAPAEGEDLPAAVILTFPDGTQARREALLPAGEGEVSFSGRLGIGSVQLYPEAELRIPLRVTCDQGVALSVPAGWYLDGEPIPYYQNSAFRVGEQGGGSGYTVRGADLSPGEHTLEFRINPQGLPGVTPAVFTAYLTVLAEQEATPQAA